MMIREKYKTNNKSILTVIIDKGICNAHSDWIIDGKSSVFNKVLYHS